MSFWNNPAEDAAGEQYRAKKWPARRPPVLPGWRGTSRFSGAWSNAYGRTARSGAATRRANTAPATTLAAELAQALVKTRTRAC